jgi:hypothetical protein
VLQRIFVHGAHIYDGAPENRICFKKLCKEDGATFADLHSLDPNIYPNVDQTFPVGLHHPGDPDRVVFIRTDMLHLIKTF